MFIASAPDHWVLTVEKWKFGLSSSSQNRSIVRDVINEHPKNPTVSIVCRWHLKSS
jgi:hypothetical protein